MRQPWKRNATPLERFESRVVKSDGCWRWPGTLNKHGDASTRIHGKTRLVHRIAYELFIGRIPETEMPSHAQRGARAKARMLRTVS